MSENLSGKYSKNLIDHGKQSAADALQTSSKRVTQKEQKQPAICNKIADTVGMSYDGKITNVSKNSTQSSL